jgi:ATP/maltotriose-dependent transcriptional regulator MalT
MQGKNPRSKARSPILTTSLRIPQIHEGLITRPTLIDKIDQVLDFSLTLITAPAGFGKTTLLGQWVTGSMNARLQDLVAWVSLESESDIRQFWTYIITSLQEVQPKLGESALASLDTFQPPIHAILRTLINEISDIVGDFVLVLDDYLSPSPALVQEFENITLARLYLLQGKPEEALRLLDQIQGTAVSKGHKGRVIEILALTALTQHALNETQFAIENLHSALKMAEPQGYVRTFVDAGQPMAALLYQALDQDVMPDYAGKVLAADFLWSGWRNQTCSRERDHYPRIWRG